MSDNKPKRTGDTISIATALIGVAPPAMTDDEWAEHDARIAAERSRRESVEVGDRSKLRRASMLAKGFPLRAIESAERADVGAASVKHLATWDQSASSVAVISGSKGCGKTVAATWWSMRQERLPTFLRAPTFARSSRYEGAERDDVLKVTALVLDDLGEEYLDAKGSFLVDLNELVDVFYGDRKPLIITTNCTKDVFVKRYGERIADRMRECAVWFSVGDASMRRKS